MKRTGIAPVLSCMYLVVAVSPQTLAQWGDNITTIDGGRCSAFLDEEAENRAAAHSTRVTADALNLKGVSYVQSGDFPSALTAFQQSLDLSRQAADLSGQSRALTHIGLCHEALGEHQAALDNLLLALEVSAALGTNREKRVRSVKLAISTEYGDSLTQVSST